MNSESAVAGREVLLAEDDPDDRFLLARAIHRCHPDLRLSMVRDGIELMEHLQARVAAGAPLPCLVLLDLNMPRMDGREVLKTLQLDPALRALPVVVLTTSTAPEDRSRCEALGAAAVVSKPEQFTLLVQLLQGLVDTWCVHADALHEVH